MLIVQITHILELPVELTSPPESTFFSKVWCTVQWSPSGLVLFSSITPEGTSVKLCWLTEQKTPIEVISHIQSTALQPCVQCWWEPSSHHIEMRHPHTGTFSTMWNTTWAASDRGETRIWILGVWCETGPEWRWDAIRQTLMEVRWDLGGAEMQFPAPRMRWGGTCMKVRPTPWALDIGEMGPA